MPAITLPAQPSRSLLNCFWLCFNVFLIPLSAAGSWLLYARLPAVVVALGILFFLAGLWHRGLALAVYNIWNGLARRVAGLAAGLIQKAVYYILILSVGAAGSRVILDRPESEESLWSPLPLDSEPSPRDWRSFLAWSRAGGNSWAVVLLPFLALLSLFEVEESKEIPEDVYTLY